MLQKIKWFYIFFAIISVVIAIASCGQRTEVSRKLTAQQINRLSQEVTVIVDSSTPGSGVIIKHEGTTYYVLTSSQTLGIESNYRIITSDKESNLVDYSNVKKLPEVDLALVPFTSTRNYPIASLGESDKLDEGSTVYVTGFKAPKLIASKENLASQKVAIDKPRHLLSPGKLISKSSKSFFHKEYRLTYNNRTLSGMDGGPILNEWGKVVGTHISFKSGIPIKALLQLAEKVEFKIENYSTDRASPTNKKLNKEWEKYLDLGSSMILNSSNNVYVGSFTNEGFSVVKYQESNPLSWLFDLPKTEVDGCSTYPQDIAIDRAENIYIPSYISDPKHNRIDSDVGFCLLKFGGNKGSLIWFKKILTGFPTPGKGVAIDSLNNVYIAGETSGYLVNSNFGKSDIFLLKYNSDGTLLWKTQLGSSEEDEVHDIAIGSSGNVFISGGTRGSLASLNSGGIDVWLAEYGNSGDLRWKTQLGSSKDDDHTKLAVDNSNNIYVTGETLGSLAEPNVFGKQAIWIAKYNAKGSPIWIRQWGSTENEHSPQIADDGNGGVYIAWTVDIPKRGLLVGGSETRIAKYDSSGALDWRQNQAIFENELLSDIALDGREHLYMTGSTYATSPNPNRPSSTLITRDKSWVVKYSINLRS